MLFPGSYPEYITFSFHIFSGFSWLYQRVSDFPWFWWPWQFRGILVKCLVKYPWTRINRVFLTTRLGLCIFEKKTTIGTYYHCWSIILDVDLDHPAEILIIDCSFCTMKLLSATSTSILLCHFLMYRVNKEGTLSWRGVGKSPPPECGAGQDRSRKAVQWTGSSPTSGSLP